MLLYSSSAWDRFLIGEDRIRDAGADKDVDTKGVEMFFFSRKQERHYRQDRLGTRV